MDYSSLSCDELVRACAEAGTSEAWEEFVCRFEKVIRVAVWRVARRYGQNDKALVKDLVQETFTKVCDDNCQLLRQFKPNHHDAFLGMISITAANVARDYFRARNSRKRGSGNADSELSESNASVVPPSGSDHIERQILLQEIDRILCSICWVERDREIFWLHYRQGLTTSSIAKISHYGLSAKGVESILRRLRLELRAKLAQRPICNPAAPVRSEGIQAKNTLSEGEGQL